jgi:hypothetical protein
MKDRITIKDIKLYPVTTSRLNGEPSQHVIVRLMAAVGRRVGFLLARRSAKSSACGSCGA